MNIRTGTRPDIVAAELSALLPALDELDRRLALSLYRELARGAPVALRALSARAGMPLEEARRRLEAWPAVYYDSEKRVIGFWGLALKPMQHRMRVEGHELFAWCAWDTLFLPELLGARAEVFSACRGTGAEVRLTVEPHRIEPARAGELRVSFVPSAQAVQADVISTFCHYVHFFVSAQAAAGWLEANPRAFLLPLAQAYEVGRIVNRARYGDAIAGEAGRAPTDGHRAAR